MTEKQKESEHGRRRRGMEPAAKLNVATLISYQPGSVVSRTVIDRKAGTVTLFAFDEGEGLSEHTAAYDALLYIIEGEALVTVSNTSNDMRAGEAIVLPAGKPHPVRARARFKMLLTMIRE